MKVGGIFTALRTTLAGMSNQTKRLDAISDNIANAERSPDGKGNVYRRKVVVPEKETRGAKRFSVRNEVGLLRTNPNHMDIGDFDGPVGPQASDDVLPVEVKEVKGEQLVYNPSHPRADANGYVHMPDVNPVEEMVDLIAATRTYEANVTVLNAAKQMAKKAMEI